MGFESCLSLGLNTLNSNMEQHIPAIIDVSFHRKRGSEHSYNLNILQSGMKIVKFNANKNV